MNEMNNGYLVHYGVPRKSGRYKWGSGKNPFHHGNSIPRKIKQKLFGKKKPNKPVKRLSEEEKDRVVNSGDAKKILKYKDQLNTEELKRANNRITQESALKKSAKEQTKSGMKKFDAIADTLDHVTDKADKIATSYDRTAKILNSFAGTELPRYDGGKSNKNKNSNDNDNNNNKNSNDNNNNKNNNDNNKNESSKQDTNSNAKETLNDYSNTKTTDKSYKDKRDSGKEQVNKKNSRTSRIFAQKPYKPDTKEGRDLIRQDRIRRMREG